MSGTVLREIDEMWQDELFAPPLPDDTYPEPVGGQRVTHFQAYLNQVDWTDSGHVSRALRVFEVALHYLFVPRSDWTPPAELMTRLRRLFARDGYTLNDDGRITGGPPQVIEQDLLANLQDAAVIQEHLARITSALERDDPAQVIGSAKELIESTAKLVLRERDVEYTDAEDVPALVSKAHTALGLHPAAHSAGPDGSDAVKKVLGASLTVTTGVAELRNRGFGTGHGPGEVRTGLSSRHSRLAVNAARLWCEFMLDTLSDPAAPWRR
ncbi:Abortive infection C-terminus [Jatrophihabitans endophyticus]|uniref:Abortive infection C-terminus n=1 Tax=Jatrophihabitans endophyticus TaxID=1206085 RepID=A0A1M5RYW4_9ACTN|nr:abortive infection family protein [Jatrophihabitans endophyticus]SHH31532.1 Abortive infection C-terminus [Jatrophihabitans endophyticus]